MRMLVFLLAAAVLLLTPTQSRATLMGFTGSMTFTIGTLDPAVVPAIPAAQADIKTTAQGNQI